MVRKSLDDAVFERRRHVLCICAAIACRRGDLNTVRKFLDSDGSLIYCTVTPLGVPLLSFALMFDQIPVAMLLIHAGCSLYDQDVWGRTPASFASKTFSPFSRLKAAA